MNYVRYPRRDYPKPRRRSERAQRPSETTSWIYGRHAVAAALANPLRRWRHLAVLTGHEKEAAALIAGAQAARRGNDEAMRVLDRKGFAAILPVEAVHQGFALEVEPLTEWDVAELLAQAKAVSGRCVVIALDQLGDPQNVGAVLRSAAAFGALAVVLTRHGAPPISAALAKAASGALESVPLVRVVNLAQTLEYLKEAGFWVCGLDESAARPLAELDLGQRVVLVLGSEGSGMRRLVRNHCDCFARLPTCPRQPSLNVSNAAAVALYELVRRPVV